MGIITDPDYYKRVPARKGSSPMEAVDTELKPCPFCGTNKYLDATWTTLGFAVVICSTCEAEGPHSKDNHICEAQKQEAIALWNSRASATPQPVDIPAEEPSAYSEVLAGTLAVHYLDCTLVEFARGLRYYAEQESRKINCDTGLIRLLQRAACVGWENIQLGTVRIASPIATPLDVPPADVEAQAKDLVSRWLMESSAFHVGLSDGNTEPDYDDLIVRIAAALSTTRDTVRREDAEIADGYMDSIGNTAANIKSAILSRIGE